MLCTKSATGSNSTYSGDASLAEFGERFVVVENHDILAAQVRCTIIKLSRYAPRETSFVVLCLGCWTSGGLIGRTRRRVVGRHWLNNNIRPNHQRGLG